VFVADDSHSLFINNNSLFNISQTSDEIPGDAPVSQCVSLSSSVLKYLL